MSFKNDKQRRAVMAILRSSYKRNMDPKNALITYHYGGSQLMIEPKYWSTIQKRKARMRSLTTRGRKSDIASLPAAFRRAAKQNKELILFHSTHVADVGKIKFRGLAPLAGLAPNAATANWYQRLAGNRGKDSTAVLAVRVKPQYMRAATRGSLRSYADVYKQAARTRDFKKHPGAVRGKETQARLVQYLLSGRSLREFTSGQRIHRSKVYVLPKYGMRR
jgi:hypothetical protein